MSYYVGRCMCDRCDQGPSVLDRVKSAANATASYFDGPLYYWCKTVVVVAVTVATVGIICTTGNAISTGIAKTLPDRVENLIKGAAKPSAFVALAYHG